MGWKKKYPKYSPKSCFSDLECALSIWHFVKKNCSNAFCKIFFKITSNVSDNGFPMLVVFQNVIYRFAQHTRIEHNFNTIWPCFNCYFPELSRTVLTTFSSVKFIRLQAIPSEWVNSVYWDCFFGKNTSTFINGSKIYFCVINRSYSCFDVLLLKWFQKENSL